MVRMMVVMTARVIAMGTVRDACGDEQRHTTHRDQLLNRSFDG